MNEQTLKAIILALFMEFPNAGKAVQVEGGIQVDLEVTDAATLILETDEVSPGKHNANLFYVFPEFSLNMNKANEKKLKTLNKKFFNPHGFTLHVQPSEGDLWDSFLMYPLEGSELPSDIKRIHNEFVMLSMFAFNAVGELM